MATNKEQREKKKFVEKMLMVQGIKYEDWLHEIHEDYINTNNKAILDNAVEIILNQNKEDKTNESIKNNDNDNRNKFNN